MSGTVSAIILLGFFFVLPAGLYVIAFARRTHYIIGEQRRFFLLLIGRICVGALVVFGLRLVFLSALYSFATDGNAVEAVTRTLWIVLPEAVWLAYRVNAMLDDLNLASGAYREGVVVSHLAIYAGWITRCHAIIAAAVLLSMIVVAVLVWGDFGGSDLDRGPVRWTVGTGLGVGSLVAVLLTRFTEPITASVDPTGEASQPVAPADESPLAGRSEIDDAIRDWKARR